MPSPRSRRGMGLRSAEARAGLLSNALENPGDVARGAATAPFTAAPDLLGMAAQMYNVAMRPMGVPPMQNRISGDPIREAVGLDPQSSAGLLGEFLDPSSAIGKGAKAVRSLLGHADKVAPTGLLGAMTLFHGTPHRFDRFDLSKIGTGEGAQAFGHGLYFAENPEVASQYQSSLSEGLNIVKPGASPRVLDELDAAAYRANSDDPKKVLAEMKRKHESPDRLTPDEKSFIDNLTESDIAETSGHLYEVDIPDEVVDNMLDYDKPLKDQPESVQSAIKRALAGITSDKPNTPDDELLMGLFGDGPIDNTSVGLLPNSTGAQAYRELASRVGGEDKASEILNQAGIPGIRFFDGSSRVKGEGTRNIVLFDPDNIREVKRDGEVVFNRL